MAVVLCIDADEAEPVGDGVGAAVLRAARTVEELDVGLPFETVALIATADLRVEAAEVVEEAARVLAEEDGAVEDVERLDDADEDVTAAVLALGSSVASREVLAKIGAFLAADDRGVGLAESDALTMLRAAAVLLVLVTVLAAAGALAVEALRVLLAAGIAATLPGIVMLHCALRERDERPR